MCAFSKTNGNDSPQQNNFEYYHYKIMYLIIMKKTKKNKQTTI